MTRPIITVSEAIILQSLHLLQHTGLERKEMVLLWLAFQAKKDIIIKEVFCPRQTAASDYFRIPRDSMEELLAHLRNKSLMVAVQIHTHQFEAFHSNADDRWAIMRHVGALSFVLPNFALQTSLDTFISDVAIFELSKKNRWIKIPQHKHNKYLRICL